MGGKDPRFFGSARKRTAIDRDFSGRPARRAAAKPSGSNGRLRMSHPVQCSVILSPRILFCHKRMTFSCSPSGPKDHRKNCLVLKPIRRMSRPVQCCVALSARLLFFHNRMPFSCSHPARRTTEKLSRVNGHSSDVSFRFKCLNTVLIYLAFNYFYLFVILFFHYHFDCCSILLNCLGSAILTRMSFWVFFSYPYKNL